MQLLGIACFGVLKILLFILFGNPFRMKKIFLLMSLLSVAVPAQAQRYDFGQGVAAMACFMLESGYSRREVENVLDSLERFVIRDGISERGQEQMVRGYNYQTARLGCELRYRN